MNVLLKTILIIFFIGNNTFLFARAGGGGHSAGGSSGSSHSHIGRGLNFNSNESNAFFGPIVLTALCGFILYSIILTYLHWIKPKKSIKVIKNAVATDELWNLQAMKVHTYDVFCKMQLAWQARNLNSVRKIISLELYNELNTKICELRNNNQQNIIEEVTINQITFISCIDMKENVNDEFTAQIDGTMIDYLIKFKTKNILNEQSAYSNGFTDSYHFIRKNDVWILDKIINQPNIFNLLDAKNFSQK